MRTVFKCTQKQPTSLMRLSCTNTYHACTHVMHHACSLELSIKLCHLRLVKRVARVIIAITAEILQARGGGGRPPPPPTREPCNNYDPALHNRTCTLLIQCSYSKCARLLLPCCSPLLLPLLEPFPLLHLRHRVPRPSSSPWPSLTFSLSCSYQNLAS